MFLYKLAYFGTRSHSHSNKEIENGCIIDSNHLLSVARIIICSYMHSEFRDKETLI